jgi:hypothetical protein
MLRDKELASDARARERLEAWAERAKASGVAELKAFATKLLQDTDAVVSAMTLPYSQGQTEGQVNKLKLVKRSMYGRGKFNLLRKRALSTPTVTLRITWAQQLRFSAPCNAACSSSQPLDSSISVRHAVFTGPFRTSVTVGLRARRRAGAATLRPG